MAYHYPFHTPGEKKIIYVMMELMKPKDQRDPEVIKDYIGRQLSLDGYLNWENDVL